MGVFVIIWIAFAILIASIGRNRKIGFGGALLISILFSPLIGLIVVLISEKHSETLMKLKIAHDSGSLSKEEYNKEVRKIMPSKEDKLNMLNGYIIVAVVLIIIYYLTVFLR